MISKGLHKKVPQSLIKQVFGLSDGILFKDFLL